MQKDRKFFCLIQGKKFEKNLLESSVFFESTILLKLKQGIDQKWWH